MQNENFSDNGVNGTGSSIGEGPSLGGCSVAQQHRPSRHSATAAGKMEWKKEVNKIAMECYLRSEPKKRGFRKRMLGIWKEIGVFHLSEQQLAGQVLCIRNGKYLSDLEIEEIQRKIDQPLREVTDESEMSDDNSFANHDNEAYAVAARPGMNIDKQSNTEIDNLSDEQVEILEKLKEMLKKPEFLETVNLRAADRAKVEEKTSKVNSVIDRIIHQSIGDINTLLLAGANVVADMMGKKKGAKKDQQEPW